jgi:hypothetical protein
MEIINAPACRFALDLLELGPADDVLGAWVRRR